jgi:hypothetical protein
MGWVIGAIYGFIMLFVGFFLADDDWGRLIGEPDSYECSSLDGKEVCQKKMKIKELLIKQADKEMFLEICSAGKLK